MFSHVDLLWNDTCGTQRTEGGGAWTTEKIQVSKQIYKTTKNRFFRFYSFFQHQFFRAQANSEKLVLLELDRHPTSNTTSTLPICKHKPKIGTTLITLSTGASETDEPKMFRFVRTIENRELHLNCKDEKIWTVGYSNLEVCNLDRAAPLLHEIDEQNRDKEKKGFCLYGISTENEAQELVNRSNKTRTESFNCVIINNSIRVYLYEEWIRESVDLKTVWINSLV